MKSRCKNPQFVNALIATSIMILLAAQSAVAKESQAAMNPGSCYDKHTGDLLEPGSTYSMTTSWYGPGLQGNPMANGERFDMNDPTITAHKVLPLGSKIRVENPKTGAVRFAEVTDDGPHPKGRELDASAALAKALGFKGAGTAELKVTIISFSNDECRDDGKGKRK
jgi:rare lipoprotein A